MTEARAARARVCHIITRLELGGAQQNTLYTLEHLDRQRFEPVLIAGSEGILVEDARALGIKCHFMPGLDREVSPMRDLRALASLTRLLRAERPDIVHTHSSKAGILGRWAACLAGVPVIVHSIHGFGFHPEQSRAMRHLYITLERVTGRLATTALVAVSSANLEAGLDLGLFDASRIALIRSGIKLGDYHPASSGNGDGPGRPVTIGMVACLKPQKAPLDFVRVASRVVRLAPEGTALRFVLAGDGMLREEVEGLIRQEGLEGVVTLAGWRRDIPDLMRGFDILLHTSRWEGLPRVFPEAMASGLPIVATRVDGAPEAIEEGVTGYLLAPGDVDGLARRTLALALDRDLRRQMGSAAASRTAPWDIDQMVRRQERLYEGLLRGDGEAGVALATQRAAVS